jgi:hypothetical protein
MNTKKKANVSLAICALVMGEVVHAAPKVIVNFKNNTADDATYMRGNSRNDVATYLNASPKPGKVVAGGSSSFTVNSNGTSPITYATVRYQAGVKSCQFTTSDLMNSTPGGVRTPKWNRSAIASGGAKCDVSVTSVNYSNHDWIVSFIMR